jgi:hypothetical protein
MNFAAEPQSVLAVQPATEITRIPAGKSARVLSDIEPALGDKEKSPSC